VARWLRSIASLLTVVAIAGTPALLSACVALCMPGTEAHVAGDHAADASLPARHAAPDANASMTACAEHPTAASPATAVTQMSEAGRHCCAEGLTAPAASITASRADTHLLLVAVAPSRVSWTSAPRLALIARRHGPAVPPPSPPRTSAVLRI
jgi:hypothetical protein